MILPVSVPLTMKLRFPNARLFMHELLSQRGLGCEEAFIQTAAEFGLLESGLTEDSPPWKETPDSCQCMNGAKRILDRYFCDQEIGSGGKSAAIWESLEGDARLFEGSDPRFANRNHECRRFAPILFDLLLQHIRRYK